MQRRQTPRRNDSDPLAFREALGLGFTVVSTTAESYVTAAARGRGEVTEMAATRKCQKYSEHTLFLPIAVETLGPMNDSAYEFFEILSHK